MTAVQPKPKMTPEELRNKLGSAYRTLMFEYPFYYTLLLMMQREERMTEDVPTMATDGKSLFYNPDFLAGLTANEVAAVLAHEALHVALMHLDRLLYRNLEDWNYAADQVVNHFVAQDGLRLPSGGVPGVGGKTAEELYAERQKNKNKGGGKNGTGWNFGGIILPKDGAGKPLSEQAMKEWNSDLKLRVTRAYEAAKQAGKMPADLERLVKASLRTKVPWQSVLQRFMSERTSVWQDWNRPARNWISQGLILPSDGAMQIANIIVACDTSGSINEQELQKMCGEVIAFKNMNGELGGEDDPVCVLWCDTQVSEQFVHTVEELKPKGGGGTMASPVFEWIEKKKYTPDAVVYFTDGYIGDYGKAPPYAVLWILTVSGDPNFDPPFGEVAFVLPE